MGSADHKAAFEAVALTARRGALRSLYEAAWQEVISDPMAALRKYQPTWVASMPAASRSRSPARKTPSDAKPTRERSGRKA
jgi:hypothetical protein